jgi:hypothetical protein
VTIIDTKVRIEMARSKRMGSRPMRRGLLAGAVGVLAAGLGATAGPAEAAPAGAPSPSCVSFDTSVLLGRVRVHNECSTNQRVKIILKNYYDSECKSMSPGEKWDHYVPIIQVDRLERC